MRFSFSCHFPWNETETIKFWPSMATERVFINFHFKKLLSADIASTTYTTKNFKQRFCRDIISISQEFEIFKWSSFRPMFWQQKQSNNRKQTNYQGWGSRENLGCPKCRDNPSTFMVSILSSYLCDQSVEYGNSGNLKSL